MSDMDNEPGGYEEKLHALMVEERKTLIESARESARTFDQAVLAFGSAVFGASVAFLKDVAPHPLPYTLKWLALAWVCLAVGLFSILLSFLWSHKACMWEVDENYRVYGKPELRRCENIWSDRTDRCNYVSIVCLAIGLMFWSWFAYLNLRNGDTDLSNPKVPPPPQKVEKGYTPPRTPPPPPPASPQQSTPPPPKK